jgi:oligoendopeptidase F
VLKAGGTLKPLELLRHAGIDLSSPAPLHATAAHVGALVDELEASFAD